MSQVSGQRAWVHGERRRNPQTRAISLVESSRSHAKSISSSQSPRIPSDPCTTLKPIELGRAPWSRFARFRGAHPHISRHPIAALTHHFERYSTISPRVAPITFPRTPKSSPRVPRYPGGRPVPAGPLPTPISRSRTALLTKICPRFPSPRADQARRAGEHTASRARCRRSRAHALPRPTAPPRGHLKGYVATLVTCEREGATARAVTSVRLKHQLQVNRTVPVLAPTQRECALL